VGAAKGLYGIGERFCPDVEKWQNRGKEMGDDQLE
jgi:hypothetical protein